MSSSEFGTDLVKYLDDHLEHYLKKHLDRKFGHICKGFIPVNVDQSCLDDNETGKKPDTWVKNRSPGTTKICKNCKNFSLR